MVERVANELGGLDVLVNNAGGARFVRAVEDTDAASFDRGIALNLDAVQHTMRAAAPLLLDRDAGGSVVNVVSIAAARGLERMAYYSAAKAGVVGLTRAAAREWGPRGVRVNCLGPGWIDTDLSRPMRDDDEFFTSSIAQIPLRRWGRAEEVASAIVFLASDSAAYVTGTTLFVDGGLLA
jgi:NAD(P)-dependent dehydrogenase (short-subunit alcohol dehydrogenase family)